LTTLISTTAYAALFVFLPIHVLTHRAYPADASPPILAVGPAELDFEFVKLGLQTWPLRSWTLYAGLVCCVVLHAVEGAQVLLRVWFADRRPGLELESRRVGAIRRRVAAVGGVILPVLLGVFVVSREPLMALISLSQRYGAAFTRSFVYRI
jgi:hypothetical protein